MSRLRRSWPILLVLVVFALSQGYSIAQSYSGRVDITDALYRDCLVEARARARIAADPSTPPGVRAGAASLTAPAEPARRSLCRQAHPAPTLAPLP